MAPDARVRDRERGLLRREREKGGGFEKKRVEEIQREGERNERYKIVNEMMEKTKNTINQNNETAKKLKLTSYPVRSTQSAARH